jgi:hypothetical protein
MDRRLERPFTNFDSCLLCARLKEHLQETEKAWAIAKALLIVKDMNALELERVRAGERDARVQAEVAALVLEKHRSAHTRRYD